MKSDTDPNSAQELLKSELDQAWNHYRHLETTRSTYVNFFFTIFLAASGFIFAQVKESIGKQVSIYAMLGLSGLLLALFCVSLVLLASIIRIGYVLRTYEDIMIRTRQYFYGRPSAAYTLWDIRLRIPPTVNRGIFSLQHSIGYLVLGVCFVLSFGELSIGLYWALTAEARWYAGFPLAIGGGMLVSLGHILWSIRRASKYRYELPDLGPSPLSL